MRRALSFTVRFIKAYFKKGRFIPREIPRLSIETTNMCDAQCIFCVNKFM
jgi:MoaA/NifB/PqqE/SkfB family radical SAM enzyme